MSANVNELKVKFCDLKWEQMLSDKYFVETCFSKKYESYPAQERLRDIRLKIKIHEESK